MTAPSEGPPRVIGRCRMAPLTDGSAKSLHAFVTDHVEPGTKVITDAWQGYSGLDNSATPTTGAASALPAPAGRIRCT